MEVPKWVATSANPLGMRGYHQSPGKSIFPSVRLETRICAWGCFRKTCFSRPSRWGICRLELASSERSECGKGWSVPRLAGDVCGNGNMGDACAGKARAHSSIHYIYQLLGVDRGKSMYKQEPNPTTRAFKHPRQQLAARSPSLFALHPIRCSEPVPSRLLLHDAESF